MNKSLLPLYTFALAVAPAHAAEPFAVKCNEIAPCAKAVGELLNQHYVFDTEVKGQFQGTPNLMLTKENAELLFTDMLNTLGYTRVPLQPGLYQIVRQRDARDGPLPLVSASKDSAPELPENWDVMTLRYKASNPDIVEEFARTSRSFMPANSRIIPYELGGLLLVTDTALNLKKLYAIIRELDQPFPPKAKERWEKARQERAAEAKARAALKQ